jgi:hypothetical protein
MGEVEVTVTGFTIAKCCLYCKNSHLRGDYEDWMSIKCKLQNDLTVCVCNVCDSYIYDISCDNLDWFDIWK